MDEWQGWRESHLWTLDSNEMFKANMMSLKTLMEHYYTARIKYLTQEAAVAIFCRDTDLLSE